MLDSIKNTFINYMLSNNISISISKIEYDINNIFQK